MPTFRLRLAGLPMPHRKNTIGHKRQLPAALPFRLFPGRIRQRLHSTNTRGHRLQLWVKVTAGSTPRKRRLRRCPLCQHRPAGKHRTANIRTAVQRDINIALVQT